MGFGLPANRLPPPPPSAFLQRLLKVSATSIAVETTSTAYCLNPCQLSFQPPPLPCWPCRKTLLFLWVGEVLEPQWTAPELQRHRLLEDKLCPVALQSGSWVEVEGILR